MGLFFLQRLDLLWPELSNDQPGQDCGGLGAGPRVGDFIADDVALFKGSTA